MQLEFACMIELYDTDLDSQKMDLVRALILERQNLKTVILNPKILLDDSEFTRKWLWALNAIRMRFLFADSKEDLHHAWFRLDEDENGRVSLDEFQVTC